MINSLRPITDKTNKTGVIYSTNYQQLMELVNGGDMELAGEFAISLIELLITGDMSTDNKMIKFALIPTKEIIKSKPVVRNR